MKKFIGSIKRNSVVQSRSKDNRNGVFDQPQFPPDGDHPEAIVVREIMAFCEAGAPNSNSAGDEYLHLPAIVDAAESSPSAAKEAAQCLQRYLSKQNFNRGFAQYNAIMLLRILTDNPGQGFTQNFDKSFVSTFKTLLRECKDSSVQQIARETLDYIEVEKLNGNNTVLPLVEMWRKEKGGAARMYSSNGRSHSGGAPHVPRESRPPRGLPPPDELSARIEESRTSARLLVQMIQSTPQDELLANELIKEFAERARQAHKSVQGFMACENPSPDENTMLTLIETSEQLGVAMNKHQRALLQARKAAGISSANTTPQPQQSARDPFATATMQNALPPSQPQRSMYNQYSTDAPAGNVYNQYATGAPATSASPPRSQALAPAQAPRPRTEREESDLYGSAQPQQTYPQYNQYNQSEEQDLYGNTGRVSPITRHEQSYLPPPGPPPPRRQQQQQQPQTQTQKPTPAQPEQPRYSAPAARQPSPTATRDYGVSENPFADDNAYSSTAQASAPQQSQQQTYSAPTGPPPQQSSNAHSMFSRAAGQLRDPQSPTRSTATELDASNYPAAPTQSTRDPQARPGPRGYHEDWQPTQSFVQRQDSSTAHITMSGASPPPR